MPSILFCKFYKCKFFCVENDEVVETAVRWLKISREPWPDILENWEITYDFRLRMLMDKTDKGAPLTVKDYYQEWEVLSLPQGYTLVRTFFIFYFFYIGFGIRFI